MPFLLTIEGGKGLLEVGERRAQRVANVLDGPTQESFFVGKALESPRPSEGRIAAPFDKRDIAPVRLEEHAQVGRMSLAAARRESWRTGVRARGSCSTHGR